MLQDDLNNILQSKGISLTKTQKERNAHINEILKALFDKEALTKRLDAVGALLPDFSLIDYLTPIDCALVFVLTRTMSVNDMDAKLLIQLGYACAMENCHSANA